MAYETQGFKLDDTGRRIVVDPVTRIEGHMRCEVNVDKNNVIRNAVSTGTMWRGLEVILKGRDPRDAWAFVERLDELAGVEVRPPITLVVDALAVEHLGPALAIELRDAVEGQHVGDDAGHHLGDRRAAGYLDDRLVVDHLVDRNRLRRVRAGRLDAAP